MDELIGLYDGGDYYTAADRARRLTAKSCNSPIVYRLLAAAYAELDQFEEAADAFAGALALDPDDTETNYNLGRALFELGRFDASVSSFDRAIALDPDCEKAHYNRGLALFRLGGIDEAAAAFRRAIEIEPNYARAHNNLGTAFLELGMSEEAAEAFNRALEIERNHAEAHSNLGTMHLRLGNLDEAEISFANALAIESDQADARFNLGLLNLLRGNFESGWQGYEWRKKIREPCGAREFDAPLWLGDDDLTGKTVFLHCEQGLGDTIQFIRYAPMVRDLGAKVIVAVQSELLPLLRGSFPGIELIGDREVPERFDFHAPLVSLPLAFGTRLETIPASAAYLDAEPSRVSGWAKRLGPGGFKIGICWQGSGRSVGQARSFSISHFSRIAKLPDIRLVSLHKGDGEVQLDHLPDGMTVERLGEPFDPPGSAFLDTAAVIKLCDLVITCDTALAHLAGALGAPVWLVLKATPEWRWLLDRDDSPWYPSMRLFRQKRHGDWNGAFAEVERALRNRSCRH